VRRKSTIDREMEIAALLDRRERVHLTPEELGADDEQLRRAVLTLWQTNLLRRTKLTVLDEVANGLSFYDYTFLHEVPRLHCALEDRLNEGDSAARGELASFLQMGSWIGGDRDGNPFVTAEVMRGTLRLQSSRVLRFYLEELHVLGSELQQKTGALLVEALAERGVIAYPEWHDAAPPSSYPPGPDDAPGVTADFLYRRAVTIYGGSNEIQRNLIARHLLGA